jgi:hypothetical protein
VRREALALPCCPKPLWCVLLACTRDAVRLSAARGKLWAIRPRTLGPLNVRLWRPAAGSSQHIDPGCWVVRPLPVEKGQVSDPGNCSQTCANVLTSSFLTLHTTGALCPPVMVLTLLRCGHPLMHSHHPSIPRQQQSRSWSWRRAISAGQCKTHRDLTALRALRKDRVGQVVGQA